jgi:hypothetical protein
MILQLFWHPAQLEFSITSATRNLIKYTVNRQDLYSSNFFKLLL